MMKRNRWAGLLALGIGLGVAGGAAAVALGHRRVHAWETLGLEDAPDGAFVTLGDGTHVHYRSAGEGDPVLLIHGFLDSAYGWDRNLAALAGKHKVYALDLPGFGYSSRLTDAPYTMDQFAQWVIEFMDQLDLTGAHVVGHSLGGAIALKVAHTRPGLVRSLVLEDAWSYQAYPDMTKSLGRVPRALARATMGWYLTNERMFSFMARSIWRNPRPLDAGQLVNEAVRSKRVVGTVDALLSMVDLTQPHNVPALIPSLDVPAQIIWGKEDRVFPVGHGERLARELDAGLEVLPETGHVPHQERPERVNRTILEFWSRVGAARS